MFTIKFTYRGQTRKHTFPDIHTFPSYEQICSQVYRVFSISNNFTLTRLLFSHNATQPSHILLSLTVNNSLDYNKCIRPHKDRAWGHGLLRFNVVDASRSQDNSGPIMSIDASSRPTHSIRDPFSVSHNPFSISAFPSVPVISPLDSMDVDHSNFHSIFDLPTPQRRPQPRRPTPQHRASASSLSSCCPVAEGRAEIHTMLTNFQENLNRVLSSNLGAPMISSSDDASRSAPPSSLCSVCTKNISARNGPDAWRSCENCHVIVCNGCYDETKPGFCLCTMGPHSMQRGASLVGGSSFPPIPRLPDPWTSSNLPTTSPIPAAVTNAKPLSNAATPPNPVIHNGVSCDACNTVIRGIRHKCLDCHDYDLCTPCISSGAAEAHDPFHEFFDITEPGRVVVHTVFSGDGERAPMNSGRSELSVPSVGQLESQRPVVHRATCDLCDSRIVGDRYKCLVCPDFDTCSACFSITDEQHPGHSFVRLQKADDCILKVTPHQTHYATCNGCSKTIVGVRYKCMHPDCPDYDLCENCEALPIPVHPQIHPMLKMKKADSVVPTVYRVGQTDLIEPVLSTFPVNNRPVSLPPSLVDEERVRTPKGVPPLPAWMALSPIASDPSPVRSQASSTKPPLPPKPEMMSQTSWPPISKHAVLTQGYFGPEISNPFADIFAAPTVTEPSIKNEDHAYQADGESDISLPSVPNHIPNPWPTTNFTERQELLQLMDDIAGVSRNASHIMKPFAEPSPKLPLVDFTSVESSMYTQPSKKESQEASPPTPPAQEFLPALQVTGDLFNSLFHRIEDVVTSQSAVSGHSNGTAQPAAQETLNKEPQSVESGQATTFGDISVSMSHLLRELEKISPVPTDQPKVSVRNVSVKKAVSVAESSISNEVLVNPPERKQPFSERIPHSLVDLMSASLQNMRSGLQTEAASKPVSEPRLPLTATFIEDVTVPDGQVFPPGAEFVKCWRLLNDSGRDWPETTELVFVAGESLSAGQDAASLSVELGKVAAGAEVDAWTGELKAPDIAGRYVGYWRLKADGELFGNSLWIEINVKEGDSRDSSDVSLAASSIIMPAASSAQQSENAPSMITRIASFSTSAVSTEDNVSDAGSDISLISMPSSSDDEDIDLWHDSRSQTSAERVAAANAAAAAAGGSRPSPANAIDYVMLYDENSSEEEK